MPALTIEIAITVVEATEALVGPTANAAALLLILAQRLSTQAVHPMAVVQAVAEAAHRTRVVPIQAVAIRATKAGRAGQQANPIR